ncbi:unnamed protein product [Blepharisma stoltei]|uniref:Peptidase A1 domain-containing protein n=1 Tax=Blepharisma stoltei TaxID=1481888 RepID=A0AAU9J1D5_9CILI|nr:unnamed protein product [Blepharisma stoltei]
MKKGITDLKSDGVIGLGFEDSSGVISIISTLEKEGKINHRGFSIHLSEERDKSDLSHKKANLIIDGYDLDKYSSEDSFTYVDLVKSTSYWEVPCDGCSI